MATPVYGKAFFDLVPNPATLASGFSGAIGGIPMGAIGAAAGAALAGGVAAGVGAFKLGESFDESFDTIRIGTGATGDALAGLESDFKATFGAVPADMQDAATAIADLNTRTGQTGEALQDLAKVELELARITDTDLAGNIASTTRLFGDWGVAAEDQAGALDKVFRASQSTGAGVGTLADQVVQFGSPLRQMGFGLDESLALFGQFEKEGVNIETVMSGMRLGLANFARAGEEPADALARVQEEIANAGSTAEANVIAIEAFGSRAGPDMAAAIREGRFELADLTDTISNGEETILGAAEDTESFGEKWEQIKNRVFVALEPIATRVFDAIGAGMDAIIPIIDWVTQAFSGFGGSVEGAHPIVTGFGDVIRSVFGAVQAIIAGAMAFWDQWGDTIMNVVGTVASVVADIIGGLLRTLSGLIDFVVGVFTGDWEMAWQGIQDFFGGAWDAILSILGNIPGMFLELGADIIAGLIEGLGDVGGMIFDKIKGGISGAIDGVKSFFGISSPSKVFAAEIGAPLSQGVGLGISQAGSEAVTAMQSVVSDVQGSVDPNDLTIPVSSFSGMAGAGGTVGSRSFTIENVTITGGDISDPEEFARRFIDAVDDAYRRYDAERF